MKHAPRLSEQIGDIQAMLGSGLGWLKCSQFWLLTIKDAALARAWLQRLDAQGRVKSIRDLRLSKAQLHKDITEVVAVAFSFEGLRALGLAESADFPFPTPYRSGMGSNLREAVLRDSPRQQWGWSDTDAPGVQRRVVHVLLAHWWNGAAAPAVPMLAPCPRAFDALSVTGNPAHFKGVNGDKLCEPFGFRDGISQPVIYGLRDDTSAAANKARDDAMGLYEDRVVAPGEFILGYRNEYNQLTYSPDLAGWDGGSAQPGGRFTRNGTYLAVRQIQQHVKAFQALGGGAPVVNGCPVGVTVAEKLMGRHMDVRATPLGWRGPGGPKSDSAADAFRYRVEDANGFCTPRGAHIRRVNPRDTLAHDVPSGILSSKLHRLLRRGRPYLCQGENETEEGLFFIACNADLERQFEFIHQRWLRNPRFVDLDSEDDPILGAPTTNQRFSIPDLPVGNAVSLAAFTTTLGGGYFFLPGLNALRFIYSR